MKIKWAKAVKQSNCDAALSFLTLTCGQAVGKKLVGKFCKGGIEEFAAKDILRASRTVALPEDTEHVKSNMEKIERGESLSPVLLYRTKDHTIIIADGMHRVSAAWHLHEDTPVKAIVVSL